MPVKNSRTRPARILEGLRAALSRRSIFYSERWTDRSICSTAIYSLGSSITRARAQAGARMRVCVGDRARFTLPRGAETLLNPSRMN